MTNNTLAINFICNIKWTMFIIKNSDKASGPDSLMYEQRQSRFLNEVRSWCKQNCQKLFFVSNGPHSFQFGMPISEKDPAGNAFTSPENTYKGVYVIAFESEEEAVLFKTTFDC